MMNALSDFTLFAEINSLSSWPTNEGKQLVRNMIEVAGCAARGDTPTALLRDRLDTFNTRWQAYQQRGFPGTSGPAPTE
jgi:hypothetical protein